jgi:hypothetical protein
VSEVGAGVTDLVLGAVLFACAVRLRRSAQEHRYWELTMWSAGGAAFAGAAHHLVFAGSPRAADLSWVVVGVLVAVAISYLLAGTATATLDEWLARLVIRARIAGLLAYAAVMAIVGIGRTTPLVLSESVTMAAVVALWFHAALIGRPGAGRMIVAIVVLAASAIFFLFPADAFPVLDARSLQHLGQIPGVLLLSQIAASGVLSAPRVAGRPAAGRI